MEPNTSRDDTRRHRPVVIALHCSGSTGRQWRTLADTFGANAAVVAPDLIGTESGGPWRGEASFSLADEAAPILDLIDGSPDPVHLVGHSYGGAVALQVAMRRPSRIASLAVYEPILFSALARMGPAGAGALRELQALAQAVDAGVASGDHEAAAQRFVDYWNGAGAWTGLSSRGRAEMLHYLPKLRLDFEAAFFNPVPLKAYCWLRMPILILEGEHAPQPTALIARELHSAIPQARRVTVRGAGHMGPLTHAADVAALLGDHVTALAAPSRASQPGRGHELGHELGHEAGHEFGAGLAGALRAR
jgi:pimeloyl-ACP methyl ester carboxylesterase